VIFDIDGTREAARQRALPKAEELPAPQRRLNQVCAPGYTGRKRGEVVRTRTVVSQAHSYQWLGSFGNKGNGHYREELRRGLAAIRGYLEAHHLEPRCALLRLDGQYAHELRNEIASDKQTIGGVKDYLSSVKVKKVEGRKECGEKKRSKLRGDVERGRNVPDKSIEHERGYFRSLAEEWETTFPQRLRDAHGMQTCRIACLSRLRDAKLQMAFHLCRQGSRNVSRKSKRAVYYAVATSARPKTFAKVAGRP